MTTLWLLAPLFAAAAVGAQDLPPDRPADFDLNTTSGQNCTFLADRNSFLEHDLRARLAVHNRVTALDKTREAAAASTTSTLARNNFIDDEIFNKLDAMGVAPAPLSSDEEFFR